MTVNLIKEKKSLKKGTACQEDDFNNKLPLLE